MRKTILIMLFLGGFTIPFFGQSPQLFEGEGFSTRVTRVADMDGDGDEDIILVYGNEDAILLLENEVTKQFPLDTIQINSINYVVNDFRIADLDGDSDLDLVVATGVNPFFGPPEGELYRLENNGNGTFTKWLVDFDDQFNRVDIADFDNDGNLDIVSAATGGTRVYFSDGFGNYTPQSVDSDLGRLVLAEDVDEDGLTDIIIGSSGTYFPSTNQVSGSKILKNFGNQNFDLGQYITTNTPTTTSMDSEVEYIDYNGDGDKDLVFFNISGLGGLYWTNGDSIHLDSANIFNHCTSSLLNRQGTDGGGSFEIFDIDNDGDMDIVRQHSNEKQISILWQESTGALTLEYLDYDWNSSISNMSKADMDGDGDLDIIIGSRSNDREISWYENISGTLVKHQIYAAFMNCNFSYGDFDADGDLDVLVAGSEGISRRLNEVFLYVNEGTYYSSWRVAPDYPKSADAEFADMDGDGDLDVVASSEEDNKIEWFEQQGNPHGFIAHTIDLLATSPKGLSTGDVNEDGNMDVIAVHTDKIVYYRSNGNGNPFTRIIVDNSISDARDIQIEDLNGDGIQDIVAISENVNHSVVWYAFDGTATFTRTTLKTGNNYLDFKICDLNGDCIPDIVANHGDNQSGVFGFFNDGAGNFVDSQIVTNVLDVILQVDAVDWDRDADIDLILASDDNVYVCEYDSSRFSNGVVIYQDFFLNIYDMDVVDLDQDAGWDIGISDTQSDIGFYVPYAGNCVNSVVTTTPTLCDTNIIVSETITSDAVVPSGCRVILDAGQSVDLNPGFEVELNAVFEAKGNGCQ